MKVILLKSVGGVGQAGEVKDVSDGYGFNYLIVRGLAVQATPDALAKHEHIQKEAGAAHEKEQAQLAQAVQALEGQRIEMKVRATEKGGLFRSITAADIMKALGKGIPESAVKLEKPIKTVGEHITTIKAAGAVARVTIAVVAA